MGVLYLVRHGQATGIDGAYDTLSSIGIEQARAVGAELVRRGVRPTRVVTGALRRQQQTAEEMGLRGPQVDLGWDEYDHLALLSGRAETDALTARLGASPDPARALQTLLDGALASWVAAEDPDRYTESWPTFRARVGDALATVASGRAEDGTVAGDTVVVTSAGPISAVAAGLLGVPPEGWLALNRVMVNTSITTVVLGRSGASLVSFNDHAHVAGDDRRLLTYR
jgi:broad specificity phosphatase PhoE